MYTTLILNYSPFGEYVEQIRKFIQISHTPLYIKSKIWDHVKLTSTENIPICKIWIRVMASLTLLKGGAFRCCESNSMERISFFWRLSNEDDRDWNADVVGAINLSSSEFINSTENIKLFLYLLPSAKEIQLLYKLLIMM